MPEDTPKYSPGLEGVIAGETSICSITDDGLRYRGYYIGELVERRTFEDVAYLLLYGELPGAAALKEFSASLRACRTSIDSDLAILVSRIPNNVPPMDAVRTAVSLHAHFDPEVGDGSHAANVRKATRLLGQLPALIGIWQAARGRNYQLPVSNDQSDRSRAFEGVMELDAYRSGSHAAYVLAALTRREPDPEAVRVMDASLILYAEHEYNASAFAARVTVSTLSDFHSGIVSAVGALKGALHGGANEKAMEMLLQVGGPEQAEGWVLERLARKERIMGFGHRVVRKGDTRAGILRDLGAELAQKRGDDRWPRTADTIQAVMEREKGMHPNVDFPCGWVYYMLGLPVDLYTPIFVASRVTGWAAHIIEQLDNNRLIRPRGLYVGPAEREVPSDRGT
jgi:citrate synthase